MQVAAKEHRGTGMAATITPPLPVSDLHRLQLSYQSLTPVPSHASGSSDDLDVHRYTDYSSTHHSQHHHQFSHPQHPLAPQHSQHAYPIDPSQYQLQHLHQHPSLCTQAQLKHEYGAMPINMAEIPLTPQDITTKSETSDDGRAPLTEMDQDEVDAIIRNKRKVRDPKACYACHRRKVKCDRNLPCDSCVKRDHPELCSYERPTKKRRLALSNALAQAEGGQQTNGNGVVNSGPNITVPKEQWERINQELTQLRNQVSNDKEETASVNADMQSASGTISQSDDVDREGVHAPSNQMGTMHLGSRSVLAYMIGNRTKSTQDDARTFLEHNILPNLGLDNETTTYPFVDLWSTDSSMQDVNGLIQALPDDELCREFWLTYRDIPCTIYPVVPDAAAFDTTLRYMLQKRAEINSRRGEVDPNKPYGVALPWLALLFAVLASGSQSTGRPAKERELTSQVYICCSYQALRMSNFLTHPSLETIQALLIIGNALSYNMNPGVSYVLLGMTLRSAISMGLHVSSSNYSEHESYLRSRIWWALAWQDSHFSVSYDRPSSSILCTPNLPYTSQSVPGNRSYVESMTGIIKLTQEILRDRLLNPKQAMSWAMITKYKDEVQRIWNEASPRLRDRAQCTQMTDHLERLALQIHCAYLISEICRPALKEDHHPTPTSNPAQLANKLPPVLSPGTKRRKSSVSTGSPGVSPSDPQIMTALRAECITYLEKTVETYVELRQINKFAARSWIGIQRSISAAFLLGVLPETRQEPRTITLLQELETGITQAATEDSGFPTNDTDVKSPVNSQIRRLSADAQTRDQPLWVRSMTKSLHALSKMNAALTMGKGAVPRQFAPMPTEFPQIPQAQSQAKAAAMYNTPATSPGSGGPAIPINMQQYPVMYTHGRPVTSNIPLAGGQYIPALGSFTPESANSNEWTYGNMSERALEYVHPGLWG